MGASEATRLSISVFTFRQIFQQVYDKDRTYNSKIMDITEYARSRHSMSAYCDISTLVHHEWGQVSPGLFWENWNQLSMC